MKYSNKILSKLKNSIFLFRLFFFDFVFHYIKNNWLWDTLQNKMYVIMISIFSIVLFIYVIHDEVFLREKLWIITLPCINSIIILFAFFAIIFHYYLIFPFIAFNVLYSLMDWPLSRTLLSFHAYSIRSFNINFQSA